MIEGMKELFIILLGPSRTISSVLLQPVDAYNWALLSNVHGGTEEAGACNIFQSRRLSIQHWKQTNKIDGQVEHR